MDVNKKCGRLHKLFNSMELHRFEKSEIDAIGFKNGIYIIFEDGEKAHGGNRIVRVGTTTGKNSTLTGRLHEHYENEGRSIFRKHIARCLLEKMPDTPRNLRELFHDSKYLKLVGGWKKTSSTKDIKKFYELHEAISTHIRNHCSFVVFPVDEGLREFWEKRIISTISSCNACGPSQNWLGNVFPKDIQSWKRIIGSGMWNVDCVNDKNILTNAEFAELETIVEKSKI
jgi:hypothetical protein